MKPNLILFNELETDHPQLARGQSQVRIPEQNIAASDGAEDVVLSGDDFWREYDAKADAHLDFTHSRMCLGGMSPFFAESPPIFFSLLR